MRFLSAAKRRALLGPAIIACEIYRNLRTGAVFDTDFTKIRKFRAGARARARARAGQTRVLDSLSFWTRTPTRVLDSLPFAMRRFAAPHQPHEGLMSNF